MNFRINQLVYSIFGISCAMVLMFNLSARSEVLNNQILIITDDAGTSSDMILEDLMSLGYSPSVVSPDLITPQIVELHDVTILSTGSNPMPCQNSFMRNILISHANAGGKILVEGGHNAYVSGVDPGYAAFMNKVLKVAAWQGDSNDSMFINPDLVGSEIMNTPNQLPFEISMLSSGIYSLDVCLKMETTQLLFHCSQSENSAGVVVAPDAQSPQIIDMCFSYAAIDRSVAKNLIANFAYALAGSPIGITLLSAQVPDDFGLIKNYPNPFNPSTTFSFSVSRSETVTIDLYSSDGRHVRRILRERVQPGIYEYKVDMAGNASGTYFLVMDYVTGRDRLMLSYVK